MVVIRVGRVIVVLDRVDDAAVHQGRGIIGPVEILLLQRPSTAVDGGGSRVLGFGRLVAAIGERPSEGQHTGVGGKYGKRSEQQSGGKDEGLHVEPPFPGFRFSVLRFQAAAGTRNSTGGRIAAQAATSSSLWRFSAWRS